MLELCGSALHGPFAVLALIALPAAIKSGDPLALVQWISQTFLQLVLLSVIIVGQNIASRASDKRAEMTYKDAEAILHDAEQIQAHLKAQDEALNGLLDKMLALETKVAGVSSAPRSPGNPAPRGSGARS